VSKLNLIGKSEKELNDFFYSIGERSYRSKQVLSWLHKKGAVDISLMTDISMQVREKLSNQFCIDIPVPISVHSSADGTQKFLFPVGNDQFIESVYIPEATRATLCISSQVGCAMDCSFCATGYQGFSRNLDANEIMGQFIAVSSYLNSNNLKPISNVVFMGMGEPLTNLTEVVKVTNLLMSDLLYGISRRRVTISTSGVVPNIYKLARETNASLAISLHAANDKLRNELVPINKFYNIEQLLEACNFYAKETKARYITFEYVMLKEINDSLAAANELATLLKNFPAKVNLIPFNPFSESSYQCSDENQINKFCKVLQSKGIFTSIRKTRGDDIDAACGQLAGKVNDRIKNRLGQQKL